MTYSYFEQQEKKQYARKMQAQEATRIYMACNQLAKQAKSEGWDAGLESVVKNLENIRQQAKAGLAGYFWDQMAVPFPASEPVKCTDYANAWFEEFVFNHDAAIKFSDEQVKNMAWKFTIGKEKQND